MILNFVLGRIENIVGKGENAGNQHFLLFPQCFQKASFPRVIEGWDCVVKSEILLKSFSPSGLLKQGTVFGKI